ncbi:hypothetical protein [Pseudomonas sp. NPDC090208]|uniref:hypothetical protein n=1 Tax=Pseudomonas sp. NPDC090208 TaxID=3364478 RepID=UPI00380B494C
MTALNAEARRTQILAEWQTAMDDKEALLASPEDRSGNMAAKAKEAFEQGDITDDDLREMLEQADAAYGWALEELLTRELNQ